MGDLQFPGHVSWVVVWDAWAFCFCRCVAFLRGGVGLSLASGPGGRDSGIRCAPPWFVTCCRYCLFCPRCWDLRGGRGRGGGSSASQVSALDRASFNFCWRWGSAFLKDKTRWGLVSPVVGVIMASYRVEGTRSLTKFCLSPGWEHWAHQMLATWLKGGGHACMKLCTMWSALGQWDRKEAASRGCGCEHL